MPTKGVGSVEALLDEISALEESPATVEIWVPRSLTLKGDPVTRDVAMAIVLDALLAKEFFPDGVEEREEGTVCRYTRE